jgi:hypothetical protein
MPTSGSFLRDMLGLLSQWIGSGAPAPNRVAPPAKTPSTSASDAGASRPPNILEPRVLMIVYNPVVDATRGKRLIETLGWNDPDQLAAGYIADIHECSGGLVNYQIAARVLADEVPVKKDGFQYKPSDLVEHLRSNTGFHDPDAVDYEAILDKFNLIQRIEEGEFDEVWLFGGPYFGFYESSMAGAGAFWCNAPVVPNSERCSRRFVIMGFNYERGIGEMLEDLGHRTEAALARQFGSETVLARAYNPNQLSASAGAPANPFERLVRYDRTAPGLANVGVLHYAPNSLRDYDWGNPRPVLSCCDDWLLFPNLPDPPNYRLVNTREWGNGDIRQHHKWWLKHLPRAAGETNGVSNNWWTYTIDVNQVKR